MGQAWVKQTSWLAITQLWWDECARAGACVGADVLTQVPCIAPAAYAWKQSPTRQLGSHSLMA